MSTVQAQRLATIYVVRHCNTHFNLEHRLQGTLDIPLCKEGRAQAKANVLALGPLAVNRIFSSPLKRAWQTAAIYAERLRVPLHEDERLRELDHGSWEGKRIESLLNHPNSSYAEWLRNPSTVDIPGTSEPIALARERVLGCVKDCVSRHSAETILIVTHKHIRALLYCALQGLDLSKFSSQIEEGVEATDIPRHLIERLGNLA